MGARHQNPPGANANPAGPTPVNTMAAAPREARVRVVGQPLHHDGLTYPPGATLVMPLGTARAYGPAHVQPAPEE